MLTENRKVRAMEEREKAEVWKEQLKFIGQVRKREQHRLDRKAVRRKHHR